MLDLRAYSDVLFRVDEVLNTALFSQIELNKGYFYNPTFKNEEYIKDTFDIRSNNKELMKEPLKNYFFEGTFAYLQGFLKELYETTNIKQWHEYGGEPYHFKLELETSNKGITDEILNTTDNIVYKYKNVRSVFDGASLKLSTKAKTTAICLIQSGERIEITPLQIRDINISYLPKSLATTPKIDEILTI